MMYILYRGRGLMVTAIGALCLALTATGTTYYVDANLTTGDDDGRDWANAFRTTDQQSGRTPLQRALHLANDLEEPPRHDVIWVARRGTDQSPLSYYPTDGSDRTISFVITLNTEVYGGFSGGETNLEDRNELAHPTILDGNINNTATNVDNSFHVVTFPGDKGTTRTKLSGFTIQNGHADPNDPNDTDNNYGGGIFMKKLSDFHPYGPSLNRLKIQHNTASNGGAGMHGYERTEVYLTNCRFECNEVTLDEDGRGGGATIEYKGRATFQNCVFYANTSAGLGGGLALVDEEHYAGAIVVNCTFHANTAGGAELDPNDPVRYGGAIYSEGWETSFVYSTIAWGNTAPQLDALEAGGPMDGYFEVQYSDIEDGDWTDPNYTYFTKPTSLKTRCFGIRSRGCSAFRAARRASTLGITHSFGTM
jgi:hypothetical protein